MRTLLAAVLTLPFLLVPEAHAQPAAATITEWAVPWPESRPRDPVVDAQGRVWFVGQRSHYVARLDPETGGFQRFDLKDGDGPHNVIVGPDGALWYAGNTAAHIGRLDPATGAITRFPTPEDRARDPHTLSFDAAGRLWFTAQGANHVGRLDPATGDVEEWVMPGGEGARPYAMAADDRDRLWFFETGATPNRLVGFDPATASFIEGPTVESGGGTVRHMVFDPASGALWFGTDTNTIGRAVLH